MHMPDAAIIEDNEILRDYISILLQRAGYRVHTFRDLPTVEEVTHGAVPLIVISDIYLPTGNGMELIQKLRKEHPSVRIILMSSDTATLRKEGEPLADAILPKPFSATDLMETLQPLLASGSRKE